MTDFIVKVTIPEEILERIATLTKEAEELAPAVISLSKRAWQAYQDYEAAVKANENTIPSTLDNLFDWLDKSTGQSALFDAMMGLARNLGGVYDSWPYGDPGWLEEAKAGS